MERFSSPWVAAQKGRASAFDHPLGGEALVHALYRPGGRCPTSPACRMVYLSHSQTESKRSVEDFWPAPIAMRWSVGTKPFIPPMIPRVLERFVARCRQTG